MNKKIVILIAVMMALAIVLIIGYKNQILPWKKYDTKLDSLFLGISFGMEKQAFYDRCMALNKEGKTIQGTQNTSVLYVDNENFKLPVDMNFYPNFYKDKIFVMPIYFNYKAWAPWNRELQSDSLILEVKSLMEKWYGPGFKDKKLESGRIGYYKIDSPRIITIKIRDEQFVDVLIENVKYSENDKPEKDEQK
jgi:hypothetical protein